MTQLLPYSAKRKAACGLSDDYYNNRCLCNTVKYQISVETKPIWDIILKDFEFVDVDFTLVFISPSL